jgi:PAS domain S-box-containing protein
MKQEDAIAQRPTGHTDVSEKGPSPEELRAFDGVSETEPTFFADAVMNAPIGIYIVQEGRFRFVNPEFQSISDYTQEELLEMRPQEIVHPDDWGAVKENATKMLKGLRSSPYLYRVMDKGGEVKWILESVSSVQFEKKRATLGYFMDTTEGELAKEALQVAEEKFHKAFRSSPEWFVISTLEDGFYMDVNEAFLRTTGYSRKEVIGRNSKELGIWADSRRRDEMIRMLREHGEVRDLEVEFRMKSGEIRQMLWSAEVIDYGDEKCLIATTRDITARTRAEKEKMHREKVQGVLETAGAACHELNQPLQFAFYIVSEILEENPKSESARRLREQLDRMKAIMNELDAITTYSTTDYIQGTKIVDIHTASKEA